MTGTAKAFGTAGAFALATAFFAPFAAAAAATDGCAPIVTVHKDLCASSIIYDCAGERLVMDYERGELVQQVHYDSDWSLVEYAHFNEGAAVLTITGSEGASMSMQQLIEEGRSVTSGTVIMSTKVIDARPYRVVGEAELTGQTETIGETEYLAARIKRDMTLSDDNPGMSFEIDALIDPSRNLMLEGTWRREAFGGARQTVAQTVRAVHEAGSPAFLETVSEFGCD